MGEGHARCREGAGAWAAVECIIIPSPRLCAVRVERTTASAGEVVVAHPDPGTVDGMSGDLGEKRAVCGWDRSWVVCTLSTQSLEAACRVHDVRRCPAVDHTASIRLGIVFCAEDLTGCELARHRI